MKKLIKIINIFVFLIFIFSIYEYFSLKNKNVDDAETCARSLGISLYNIDNQVKHQLVQKNKDECCSFFLVGDEVIKECRKQN